MVDTNRAFFSQDQVDGWLAEGVIRLDGDVLTVVPEGPAFQLESAVLFQSEVARPDDAPEDARNLCGRVKTVGAITALSGEHVAGSVVLGDNAYEVLDGFVGELVLTPGLAGLMEGQEQRALAALQALAVQS